MNPNPSLKKQPKAPSPNLQSLFVVKRVGKEFRNIVARRGAPIRPFERVSNYDANWMKQKAYDNAGLSEYNDCWTGEMRSRPIPFVSTDRKPLYAQELMAKHIKAVFAFIVPQMVPHVQPINKVSSLGFPIHGNPGTGMDEKTGMQLYESKFDIVCEVFRILQSGDFSMFDDMINTISKRLQNESPAKEREYQFITSAGDIVQRIIKREDRLINVPDLGMMVGSRTRIITQPAVVNLWIQCWDSMIHNAIMKHPLCGANMYAHEKWPSDASFRTFDCKHYERYLGMAAITYAEAVGGRYGEVLLNLIHAPFIVPSDDWKAFFEISPQYKSGVYPQFSSGLAPVAPLGKLTNICAQVEYFTTHKGMNQDDAVKTVFSGSSIGLNRWMYGDDNRVMGDASEMESFISFMSTVFEIEEDEKPKYLGMEYTPETAEFMLPESTYNLKLYQPERDFSWKDYPNLGMVERRDVFSKFGVPSIPKNIIPFENGLWDAIEHPFHMIVASSIAERMKAAKQGVTLNKWEVTDKDYLMTDQERLSSGQYWHFKPEVTATIVLSLVSDEIKDMLTFKHAPFTPVPPPARKQTTRIVLDGSDQHNETDTYENTPESIQG
jgi:hypothetical protein